MAYKAVAFDTAPNTTTVDVSGADLTDLQVGEVMVAGIFYRDAAGNITAPPGWTSFGPTQEVRTADGVSVVGNLRCYWRVAQSGDNSAVFTWTMVTAQTHIGIVAAFTGRNTSSPIGASAGFTNTVSQATIDAPDVATTAGADILEFAAIGMTGSFTVTGLSLAERADVSEGGGGDGNMTAATEDGVAAGTYTAGVFTQSQASGWHRMAAITVAVAASAAPGGVSSSRNMMLLGVG